MTALQPAPGATDAPGGPSDVDVTGAAAPPSPATTAARRRHPVRRFLLRRFVGGVGVLIALSVLVFLATSVVPGDPAAALLGRRATPDQLAALRQTMGLDRSLVSQYWHWVIGLLHGDLGNSAAGYAAGGRVSIWSQISGPLGNSAVLAMVAIVPIVLLSTLLGVVSALRAGRWVDHLVSAVTLIPAALPEFVFGAALLAVFFSWLGVLPPVSLVPPGVNPLTTPSLLVLPVLTLIGVCLGPAIRMVRAGMIDALRADWVAVARLNGIAERKVVRRYALRNALAPSIQVFALIAQYLIGGLLIVEYLFDFPGIGKELVSVLAVHDNLEVQSVTMLLAACYVAITVLADLAVMLVVPKLRTAEAS